MRIQRVETLLPPLLFGMLVALDVQMAIIEANRLPLLDLDSVVLYLGAFAITGLPSAAVLLSLAVAFGPGGVSKATMTLLGLGVLALVGVAVVEPTMVWLFVRRHVAVAVFLVGVALLGRNARLSRWSRMIFLAAVSAGLGVALSSVTSGAPMLIPKELRDPVASNSGPHDKRILLIGVDGLCHETLQRWQEQSPNEDFKWLRERSYIGPLETIAPTHSPTIWTSIATGAPPEDHGVLGFTSWRVPGVQRSLMDIPRFEGAFVWLTALRWVGLARTQPVSSLDIRKPTLWEIVGEPERPADVVGWWATWPALPLHGRMVTDRFYFWRQLLQQKSFTTLQRTTHPPELADILAPLRKSPQELSTEELLRFIRVSEDEASDLVHQPYRHHQVLSELPIAFSMDETHYAVAEKFLREGHSRGLFVLYFRGVDLISHSAMQYSKLYPESDVSPEQRRAYGDTLSDYYAYTFTRLRRLVEAAGDGALIMVISDHGFERLENGLYGHDHAPPGVIMVVGVEPNNVAPGLRAGIYDVLPTVLWLTGYPVADDMPGRALSGLFPQLETDEFPIHRRDTYGYRRGFLKRSDGGDELDEQVAEEMLELLRGLGYID